MTESFSIEAFVFILILVVYVLTAQFVEVRKIPYLHESGVAIIMGFLAALFVRYTLETEIQFDNEVFFTIILPPIIFSAGYSLRKSLFFQHFGMITFLGIIGTILCFICLTLVIQIADSWIFHALTVKQIMLLSSVLCATDTVAAMSLIKPEKYPVLNAVLFGEGIINDAVAIILFRTVLKLQLEEDGGIDFNIVFVMIFDFLVLFIFSLAIGASFGFGLSYLLKINQSFNRHPIKETSLILLVGYMAYLIGELLGFSGIITLFTCSVIMGHYTFMNISEESQRGTGLAFETVSYIAEAFVYAYLGASVFGLKGEGLAVVFAIFIMIFLPLIRAVMVYLLPWIYKCKSWDFPLNDKQLKVCWYSGLVRGVIAFALCLQIETDHNDYIVTIVLVIVMLTTLVGASMLKTFASYIQLEAAPEAEVYTDAIKSSLAKSLLQDSIYKPIDFNLESGAQEVIEHDHVEKGGIKQKLEEFQNNYVVPLFKRSRPELTYEIEISTIQKKKPLFDHDSVV